MSCQIKKNASELIKKYSGALKLLGITKQSDVENFLSMFLKPEMYAKYQSNILDKGAISNGEQSTNSNNNDSIVSVINTDNNETIASTANEIITGDNDGRTIETNENKTTSEVTKRTEENGRQVSENEIVKSFKDKVLENRANIVDYTTSEKIEELKDMTESEIDALIEKEGVAYNSYVELLKEKHSYEKLEKTLSEDGKNIYAYVKSTINSSLKAISNIIDGAKKGFEKYSENILNNSNNQDKAFDKIDEKYSELSSKTLKPLNEVKKQIESIKDDMKVISENRSTFDLMKIRQSANDLIKSSGITADTGKVIYDDMKLSLDNIFTISKSINQLKQDARKAKVNYDDYDLNGKTYRELKRDLEKEKSKVKIYSEAIVFFKEHSNPIDEKQTFDLFMTGKGISTVDNKELATNNKGYVRSFVTKKMVYNKFAKYFTIDTRQRQFYTVTDLPKYLTSGSKVITESKNEAVIAKTVFAVIKQKGASFQKRHFGGKYSKDNIKQYEEAFNSNDINQINRVTAMIKENLPDLWNSISKMNSIDFKFPDTFKSLVNFDYHSKEGKAWTKDYMVTLTKLDETGIPFIASAKSKTGAKADDITKQELTDNSNISLISLLPGSMDARGSVGKFGKEAVLDAMNEVSDDVKNAIKVHTIATIEDLIKINNLSSNDDEFIDVWGIDKGSFDGDMKDIENLGRQGYIPRSVIVQKLGSAIYNDIGIKFNGNVSTLVSDGIKTELGLLAVEVMNLSGVLDNSPYNVKLYNVGSATNEKNQALIRLVQDSKFSKDENGKKIVVKDDNKIFIEDFKDMSTLMNHLYSFDTKKKPSLEKPTPKFNRTVRNGFQKVSEDTNRILNDYESVGHKFNDITKDVYDLWKIDPKNAYQFLGIGDLTRVSPENKNYNGNTHNIEDAIAQASKFNNERLELDTLMEFYEDNMFDKETGEIKLESPLFYIPWDFTVSGRYMMDSNINAQTGKVATRYLTQSKEMDSEMKTVDGVFDKEQMHQFKVGLAQGFGTGIDKSTDDTAFAKMEEKFTIDDKGNVEFKEGKDGKLTEAHKGYLFFRTAIDEKYTSENEKEQKFINAIRRIKKFDVSEYGLDEDIEKVKEAVFKGFYDFIGKPVHQGEETHTLTAMRALAEIDMFAKNNTSGSDVFNHTFTTEADDITSGMILTLMGLGTEDARKFLEKGGVYTTEAQEFWKDLVSHLGTRDSSGNINTGNEKLDKILKSYKGYLTHGFLVEFGKLMDSSDFKNDIVERLKDNEKYNINVINDRIHFKDFYNTVAHESGKRLNSIKYRLDRSFVKDEDKAEFIKNNSITVQSIKNLVHELVVKDPKIDDREKAIAIEEYISRNISANLDSNTYSTLNNYSALSRTIAHSSLGDGVIPKYDATKTYSVKDISSVIDEGIKSIELAFDKSNNGIGQLLLKGYKEILADTKFDKKALVYRQFLRRASIKVEYIQGASQAINNGFAISAMNDYMNRNIKDRESYDAFFKSFRKEYTKAMNKEVFDKGMFSIKDQNDPFYKIAKLMTDAKKSINEYNKEKKNNNERKSEINTFDIASYFRDRANQRALITLAGNNISRNAAKSPVMVFIYGSSLGTIKKSIANIVGKEAIYNEFIKRAKAQENIFEAMNNANSFDLQNKDFALRVLLSEMTPDGNPSNLDFFKSKSFKVVDNEEGIVENVDYKMVNNLLNAGVLSNLVIDEDMMEPIYNASKFTYGKSFEDTFSSLFDTITKSREIIKFNEIVRYSIFKSKLNDAFKALAFEKGLINYESQYTDSLQFSLTKNDVKDIKHKLEKDGFGHSNLDANGARQSLDKMTAGLVGKRVTISFKDANGETDTSSFSGSFKTDTENTGAAPVTGIHQLDGRKIGLSLEGTGVLNIYDAFYSSSNDLDKTSNKMNEEFLNTVESYNLIRTSLKEVENMILSLTPVERNDILNSIIDSKLEYTIIEEGIKKINTDYDIFREGLMEFSPEAISVQLSDVFQDINSNLSNPTEVLVRHNQLSDSATGHTGTAFNHDFEEVDFGLVFSFMTDIVEASRRARLTHIIDSVESVNEEIVKPEKFNGDSSVDRYIRNDIADKEDKDKFIITRNEEAYNKNLGIINKLIKGLNINDESKDRFSNILEEFKKCIS